MDTGWVAGAERRPAHRALGSEHAVLAGRRVVAAWFAAFTVYAGATIFTGHADGTWAAWACGGYAVDDHLLLVTRNWLLPLAAALAARSSRRWSG